VIERSLEKAIVTRFRDRIVGCLKHPSKEEEMNLRRNILKAQEKGQEFFGVKVSSQHLHFGEGRRVVWWCRELWCGGGGGEGRILLTNNFFLL